MCINVETVWSRRRTNENRTRYSPPLLPIPISELLESDAEIKDFLLLEDLLNREISLLYTPSIGLQARLGNKCIQSLYPMALCQSAIKPEVYMEHRTWS